MPCSPTNRRFRCRRAWSLAFVAGLGAAAAGGAIGDVIPIINPGFELLNVALRPGEQTSGAGGAAAGLPETPVSTRWQFPFSAGGNLPQTGVIVPGWRSQNPAGGGLAGVLNPNVMFNGQPWMTGYGGNYVGVAQAAFLSQTLDVQIRPATRYTLTFRAGIGITDSEYAPLLQLLVSPDLTTFARPDAAGVVALARADLVSITRPAFGVMQMRSLSYTSPDVLPAELAGKFLAITFLGSDGIPRVVYDDFQLEAMAVPGPPMGMLAVLGWVVRRQKPMSRRTLRRSECQPASLDVSEPPSDVTRAAVASFDFSAVSTRCSGRLSC